MGEKDNDGAFMFIRVIPRIVAFLCIAEALVGALSFSQIVGQISIYNGLAIALIVLRAFVNAFLFAGGWTLANGRPQGRALASYALIASAVLTVFDVGLNLAPSNVYYWLRWRVTLGYAVYAVAAVLVLGRREG